MNRLYILPMALGLVGSGFSETTDVKEGSAYTLFVNEPSSEMSLVGTPVLGVAPQDVETLAPLQKSEIVSEAIPSELSEKTVGIANEVKEVKSDENEQVLEQQVAPPRKRVRRSFVKKEAQVVEAPQTEEQQGKPKECPSCKQKRQPSSTKSPRAPAKHNSSRKELVQKKKEKPSKKNAQYPSLKQPKGVKAAQAEEDHS